MVYKKTIGISVFLSFLCIMISPFISLLLPDRFRDHVYYRLGYNVIAYNEIQGITNTRKKMQKIFDYVVNHEFARGNPYKCKPFESLLFAEAYCDFQSRTLNALLSAAGINSRYAMLLDKNLVSPHTLNEVLLDGQWLTVDTTTNFIFEDSQGKAIPLEKLINNFNYVFNNVKFSILKEYNNEYNENLRDWYSEILSSRSHPVYSIPDKKRVHIFDRINDFYFLIFKDKYSNFHQDIYLKFKTNIKKHDLKLFYYARNYHLFAREGLALRKYNELLSGFPDSAYAKDALFFMGLLYFEIKKDYDNAIYYFKRAVGESPEKWGRASFYYLGKAYAEIGNYNESVSAYDKSNVTRISPDVLFWMMEHKSSAKHISHFNSIN